MNTLTKFDIGGIIENSERKMDANQHIFLSYVADRLRDGSVLSYDFAEQIKRSACDLHYCSLRKTGEIIDHPLACSPELENIGDFVADIRETVRLIFPEEFAHEVTLYLPERFYNNPYKKI